MGPETTARPLPGETAARRPWEKYDPQVLVRFLLIELEQGCQACGSVPHSTTLARSMNISPEVLREFVREQSRLTYPATLDRLEWWVWRKLNPQSTGMRLRRVCSDCQYVLDAGSPGAETTHGLCEACNAQASAGIDAVRLALQAQS